MTLRKLNPRSAAHGTKDSSGSEGKPKRIVIFSTNYLPFVGGAEIAIKEITDRIEDVSFEMIVPRYERRLPAHEKMGNVMVHRVGFGASIDKLLSPFFGLLQFLTLLRSGPVAASWAMMATYASGTPYILNMFRFWKKIPIILTLQEGDSEEHIGGKRFGAVEMFVRVLMLPVLIPLSLADPNVRIWGKNATGLIELSWRLALPRTTYLTVISTYLKDRAIALGFQGTAFVIPNGVAVSRFTVPLPDEKRASIRASLGVIDSDVLLITTSRLTLKNAVDDIIRSLSSLPSSVMLAVLGTGPDKEMLEKLAIERGVSDRVRFLGHIDHSELPSFLKAADIFIRPSLSEGMGNSFIEAMAADIPVIATPVGGIPDFLFHEKTGLFATVRHPESIAAQVTRLMEDGELRKTIVKEASMLVAKEYDWDLIAAAMRSEVFEKVR